MPPIEPLLRPLTVADAAECAALANSIGWTHTAAHWERYITWGGRGALGLSAGGCIVTTAVAIVYSQRLAWVGGVITHPEYQGRGFARKLMVAIMDTLAAQGIASVMLDASPLGYPLYDHMGFRSLYKIEVYSGLPKGTATSPPSSIQVLSQDDLAGAIDLDAALNGVPRPAVLRGLWQPGAAWIDRKNERVEGYLLAQVNPSVVRIAPWAHERPEGARNLLSAVLNAYPGQEVSIQIPEPNTQAKALAEGLGLKMNRTCTRMVYGQSPPGRMADQYAIAAFATG